MTDLGLFISIAAVSGSQRLWVLTNEDVFKLWYCMRSTYYGTLLRSNLAIPVCTFWEERDELPLTYQTVAFDQQQNRVLVFQSQ